LTLLVITAATVALAGIPTRGVPANLALSTLAELVQLAATYLATSRPGRSRLQRLHRRGRLSDATNAKTPRRRRRQPTPANTATTVSDID